MHCHTLLYGVMILTIKYIHGKLRQHLQLQTNKTDRECSNKDTVRLQTTSPQPRGPSGRPSTCPRRRTRTNHVPSRNILQNTDCSIVFILTSFENPYIHCVRDLTMTEKNGIVTGMQLHFHVM